MGQDDDDLRLNTLHRFAKRSSRLVLEEHSHCEVPAGCGGVVLRWVNPDAGTPLLLHTFGGEIEAAIDGVPVNGARAQAAGGARLLAVRLRVDRPTPFLFVATLDAPDENSDNQSALFASVDDGSWLATTVAPAGSEWMTEPFDDAGWRPLGRSALGADAPPEEMRWRFDRIVTLGAIPLELPSGAREVWIRKRFRVEPRPR